jgi:aspartyl-tRNA(Asn)/glutamyl-tRNA(Gln) amidotransferase subunit A
VDADGTGAVEKAAQILADNGALVEQADVLLPDTSAVFGRVWGVALSRVVKTLGDQASLLDPGILQVASSIGEMSAVEFMDAESMRAMTANAMSKLTQRFDLLLCPTVPAGPPLAGAPIADPMRALWTEWAPWTFTFNLSRQPAITVPMGVRSDGLPNSVQMAAAQYRDDLVLRAARTIEITQPFAVVDMG